MLYGERGKRMARGKRIAEGKTLVVYSTKVLPETRALLDALAKANGPEFGQRELLEEMAQLYMRENSEKAQKARAIMELLGYSEQGAEAAPITKDNELPDPFEGKRINNFREAADPEEKVNESALEAKDIEEKPRLVKTVRYVGNPRTHLYEPGNKNSTGCGAAGPIDPETIQEQSPDAVDCKKCRYCRKAVFA